MEDFQQRVVDEAKDLEAKLGRLRDFFTSDKFKGLPADEQERLTEQELHMTAYLAVLKDRIEAFTK